MRASDQLFAAISTKQARVAVLGLGFAGLSQAMVIADAGFTVTGIDLDRARVAKLANGESYITDVSASQLQDLTTRGRFTATVDTSALALNDCIVICLPTGITADRRPVLVSLEQALGTIGEALTSATLVIIESSVPPGTTRRLTRSLRSGAHSRKRCQVFVVHAPERIDPGNIRFGLRDTPRVVGGDSSLDLDLATKFYEQCGIKTVPVTSVEVAELTKVFENTFRFVNISLVNELAQIAAKFNVSAWEVLDAAATKPYGFMAHDPGPGIGGSCIPVIPFFLADAADQLGVPSQLIAAADQVNRSMPKYVTRRVASLLGCPSGDLLGREILVLGATYKPDQTDCRNSPALPLVEHLVDARATVYVHDPLVTKVPGLSPNATLVPLTPKLVTSADLVVLVTPHRDLPYEMLVESARCLLDTRNALSDLAAPNVVPL